MKNIKVVKVWFLYASKIKLPAKLDPYFYKMFLCKPHHNHKAKTYDRFTKEKEKGIKT